MNRSIYFIETETQKYTIAGALFGLLFPVIATLLRLAEQGLPFNLTSMATVQSADRLLWIIDTAPIFLGLFASIAGRRQDRSLQLNLELKQREQELSIGRASLEQRVNERTTQLVERASQLQAVSEVARAIASVQNIETLLPQITKLLSERFGFYHTGIFLIDLANEYAVLQASSSEGGKQLINREHKLKLDSNSIVGYVASRNESRIARDVEADEVFLNNPYLPDTRSEMALPLRISDRVIGVLDVQSIQSNVFSGDDISTLEIMADQVAIAIENARLFSQASNALAESEKNLERLARGEWNAYVGRAKTTGYTFDGTRTSALVIKSQPEKVKALAQTGRLSLEKESGEITIPIKYRGQTVGFLDAKSKRSNRKWTRDEITLLESAAERAALALENARLVETSQRRADRERAIGEISTKIGAVSDLDTIMQTAVEELGRRLAGAAEVSLELDVEQSLSQE